ncbi:MULTISPECIES: glycerol-3-phosphate 1-O-acyltransferase PlsB [unclassified Gilliamella]|uniref:glycerol-3-phosphate 1-O-acyltransferase PlsB n=1 Tax=unclassified Gilliamella TaxID=2685620 RepID=UPI001C6A41A2|nr:MULTISPECIES: glycerol-3-phosphate 1-O-acyltransferase PlsB [unclassified Gilliamella]MCX8601780.1 glycerol-3-phosphate 1-O-acyltransferase PlsB [Gilliamella sp. B3722]MCX8608145.1 glycerol-3-phosphate 1-O-acyltransferase PlsB [Gilliamella sp. B3771]MCX8611148.1 glycerol-3-phosphate 1-O-acyltransferase PlsB [Gilliamella sp. B3891]MCX8613511.1 glycerol-3-phosphate 1-O-acyltransferase PlsB [Gilliamella sp. B3773]MCX8614392.1 glycerol-3-phosphate 1-O-acyltransferase PlsB [Gilliamella sp. B3770
MFPWWTKIYLSLIQIPVKLFVKSKPIPTDPITELDLDTNRPILYVLPYNSQIDLMVVRSLCLRYDLPDPLKGIDINGKIVPAFIYIDKGPGFFASNQLQNMSIDILKDYISAHQQNEDLDIQMLPVSVMFGRSPDKEGKKKPTLQVLGATYKLYKIIVSGRDCYTRFSRTVSFKALQNDKQQDISVLAHKLARVARIHFAKQRMASVGPKLPVRQEMLNGLLKKPGLAEAIEEEAKSKNISQEKAQRNALAMLNEIAANFSYRMLRITDFVLTWAWNRLYQGLKVTNADPVRELAQNGHEIVYAPCHRSHMDYLLLSYVLYRQGLVPPHIAAGINLNFWPAGPIFRRLGAFFIRRSFRGNKLYTSVFREYLAELFIRGYAVEYFIEGGRSRTGRLLDPKTGMLMMTVQTLLRGDARPITIVPVYIGYEHVLEVATYANELRGAQKKKESLWRTIKAFLKLKKLGYGYVNFGHPIPLNQFLTQQVPQWRDAIEPTGTVRPNWLTPTTNLLAKEIMERINSSAAINAMNLCCSILLAADQRALTKVRLLEHISYLIKLFKSIPYSDLITIPDQTPEELFEHAKQMGKFVITTDEAGEIVGLTAEQAILMTYYRNNIQHLLIIPAIVARILLKHNRISSQEVVEQVKLLFPLIKSELFLYHNDEQLTQYVHQIIDAYAELNLISYSPDKLTLNYLKMSGLQLLSSSSKDTLQRYVIAFSLLQKDPSISRGTLEKEARLIAERLSVLHGINAPEFFDKGVFSALVSSMREQGYLDDKGDANLPKIEAMNNILKPLITARVMQTIDEINPLDK